jgi:hypothetical protein
VLGLDGDPLHVVAAKEMKERGQVRIIFHYTNLFMWVSAVAVRKDLVAGERSAQHRHSSSSSSSSSSMLWMQRARPGA